MSRWRLVARALLLRVATAALPSVSAAQTQRTRDTTRQTDQRANRTGTKGSTTGATLPTGTLPPIITPVLCTLSGAPPTLLASAPSCRPCSADYTEGPATLWARAPTCTACPRPGIGRYWSGGAMCTPKTLMATLSARARLLVVTADPAGSTAPLGAYPITTWTYNFGDGSPNVVAANSTPPTHTYAAAGTYTITLTVSNTMGDAPGSATQSVTVSVPPCVAGAPQSQTVACPIGQSGLIIQERLPDTGAAGPLACPYLPWTTTRNTCVPDVTLTGSVTGTGSATLTIAPAGVSVNHTGSGTTTDTRTVASGSAQTVTITASGGTITTVTGCTGFTTGGRRTTCTVSPTANTTVSATVTAPTVNVVGRLSGTGTGTIARAFTINKPTAAAATGVITNGPAGSTFTVTITAGAGSTIASVSGCTGFTTGGRRTTCTVTPMANTTVRAVVNTTVIGPYQLRLFANGVAAASGTVSTPLISAVKTAGGADAIGMDLYSGGETFTITITATGGSTIQSVTGCTATGTSTVQTCTHTMSADRMVLAVFAPPVTTAPLTLEVQGVAATAGSATNGTMTATKTSMGANASNTGTVTSGTSQTITITANAGSTIQSVAGCRARGTATSQSCTFTMPTIPRTITAILAPAVPPDVWVTITSTAPAGTSGRALYRPSGWQVDNLGVTGQINAIPVPQGRTQTITLTGFSGATLSRITGCTGAVIGASSTRCTITPMANTAMTIVWRAAPPTTTLTLNTTVPVGGYTGSVSINPLGSGMMNPGVSNDNLTFSGVPVGSTQTLSISSTGGAPLQRITNCVGAVIGSTSTRCTVSFPGPQTVQIVWGTAPPPPTRTLLLQANGAGAASGSVTNGSITATRPNGGPNGSNSQAVPNGSVQTITITATSGSTIASVTGCAASGSTTSQTCSFNIFSNTTITATFQPPAANPTLSLQATGTGAASGSVTNGGFTATRPNGGPNGFTSQGVPNGSVQTITITATGGSTINSVTGCAATGSATSRSCSISIFGNTTITANFAPPAAAGVTITAITAGTGLGTVALPTTSPRITLNHPGFGNPSQSGSVTSGSMHTVSITANAGSTIRSVSGCAGFTTGGTFTTCFLMPFSNTTINVRFARAPPPTVTLTLNANGSGTASGSLSNGSITATRPSGGPNGTNSQTVASGSFQTITITATGGSTIASVTGCAASGSATSQSCSFSIFSNTTITATFNPPLPPPPTDYTVTLQAQGTGGGVVTNRFNRTQTSKTAGGPNTSTTLTVPDGTTVTFTAARTGTSTVASLSGASCFGSGGSTSMTCSVTVLRNLTITGQFTAPVLNLYAVLTTSTASVQAGNTYTARLCSSSADFGAAPVTNYQITRNGFTIWNRPSCGPVSITPASAGTDTLVGTISNGGIQPNRRDTENVMVTSAPLCTLIGVPALTPASSPLCTQCLISGMETYAATHPSCNTLANVFRFNLVPGMTQYVPATRGSIDNVTCTAGSMAGTTITVTCSAQLNPYIWGASGAGMFLYRALRTRSGPLLSATNTLHRGTCMTWGAWRCTYVPGPTRRIAWLYSSGTPNITLGNTYAFYGPFDDPPSAFPSNSPPVPVGHSRLTMHFRIPNVTGTSGFVRMPWQSARRDGYFAGTMTWQWTLRKM